MPLAGRTTSFNVKIEQGYKFVNESNTGNPESCRKTSIKEQECPKVINTGRCAPLHTQGIKSKSEVWSECFLL